MASVSTAQIRSWWAPLFKKGYTGRITLLGREGVKYHEFTLEAWRAFESALTATGYGKASIVSTYYPRLIGGGPIPAGWAPTHSGISLHSFSGTTLDIDPALNPFIKGTKWDFSRCKFTPAQVDAVLAIRTNSGAQVWRWGGDFGDYMHWQLNCSMDDISSGVNWSTVAGIGNPDSTIGEIVDNITDETWLAMGTRFPMQDWSYYTTEGMATVNGPSHADEAAKINAFNHWIQVVSRGGGGATVDGDVIARIASLEEETDVGFARLSDFIANVRKA